MDLTALRNTNETRAVAREAKAEALAIESRTMARLDAIMKESSGFQAEASAYRESSFRIASVPHKPNADESPHSTKAT